MCTSKPASAIPGLGPETYTRWRASQLGIITERLERQLILELAGYVAGRRILDVGCGNGEFAVELSKCGARAVGIDASAEVIAAVKAQAKPHNADITFEVATAEDLPFSAAQFDLVTAITILCVVDEHQQFGKDGFDDAVARISRIEQALGFADLGRYTASAPPTSP
jgi:2-polyprenyl-3-methyl-5-hydroxy-6-metoxy-1,4-benzoquinol methylase